MKKILKYILIIIPFVILLSCSTEPERHDVYYLIKADSIHHPSSVALNDTIVIKPMGLAGTDGCHSFSHFESLVSPLELDLKLWGKVSGAGGPCTAVLVPLDVEYRAKAKERGTFIIIITQPDGSLLKDSVIVM